MSIRFVLKSKNKFLIAQLLYTRLCLPQVIEFSTNEVFSDRNYKIGHKNLFILVNDKDVIESKVEQCLGL